MESRQSIMSQIEDVECFKNCTKLCKPHESNKIMWELYKNKDNLNKKQSKLSNQLKIIKNKLDNKTFVDRAPKHIVEQEKNIYNDLKINIEKINFTLNSLK